MNITGEMIIGFRSVRGTEKGIQAVNPATNELLAPVYLSSGKDNLDEACRLADAAFDIFRETSLEERAAFLEEIANQIMGIGDELILRAMSETGLPRLRLEGERGRTVNQLKLFADVVRSGNWLDIRIDQALPDRQPLPRSDLRQRQIALGPVAVFGASNFPLAFSVAGGDTASALAAGCPVIVKAHSAHPGTSELVGRAIQTAVKLKGLPEGTFSMLFDSGTSVGAALVAHPTIKAVGFTGSRAGGTALMKIASERAEPIPVYAEMCSINPVFLMPAALQARGAEIAKEFISSLSMGAGQFCTNPGLVIAVDGDELDVFMEHASNELVKVAAHTMLTPGICAAYRNGVDRLKHHPKVTAVGEGQTGTESNQCQAGLYEASTEDFLSDASLSEEIFGASSLVVRCRDISDFNLIAESLEGQLTATLQLDMEDYDSARSLLPVLERRVGRILCNGFPTGVEVCHAMVHGGPFPATSDPRMTSVGSAAINRFLRPVCYQDFPDELIPNALKDTNPLRLSRLIDGRRQI
ncbi:aldehyde dehydrogenase (NADP(+)) [Nitrincola sp. MINF-07-Sa-05]|uniref:aldehyde dehydrogenase (NADP(+)) n=1 Tax=Nitrincola salilacus TaxID=3400273 RepID=UPI003917D7D5